MPHISVLPIVVSAAIIASAAITAFSGQRPKIDYGQTGIISGTVASDPSFKKNDWRFALETELGRIYVMLRDEPDFARSDRVTLRGKIAEGFGEYVAFLHRPNVEAIAHPRDADLALQARD